jgi:hypothetical protein
VHWRWPEAFSRLSGPPSPLSGTLDLFSRRPFGAADVTDYLPDLVRWHFTLAMRRCRRPLRCREPAVALGMLGRTRQDVRRIVMDASAQLGEFPPLSWSFLIMI